MPDISCPSCGHAGKGVPLVTLQHLLTAEALSEVSEAESYRHCAQPGCDVAYFAPATSQTLDKREVGVLIGTKETGSDRPVCYCFDHSWGSIEAELKATGATDVVETITAHCKAGDDRCPETNPQGSCCLGNVRRAVKESKAKLNILDDDGDAPETPDGCGSASGCEVPESDDDDDDDSRTEGPVFANSGGLYATGGALAAAVLSSACCWLPLSLIALGMGTTTVAGVLEAYRGLFLAGAGGLLALGYYFVWFRKERCEPGAACEVPRPRLQLLNRMGLSVATVLIAGFAFFPSYAGGLLSGAGQLPSATASADDVTRVLSIDGMTCEACTSHIRSELEAVPGVKSAHVSYADGSATVVLNDVDVPNAALFGAVKAAGYAVQLKVPVHIQGQVQQ